jgi:hypothetical protein
MGGEMVPLKPQSPLFGKDIVIYDQPEQNQKNVAVCSAFNGWLYAAYTYDSIISSWPYTFINLLRSTDNGLSWSSFYNWPIPIPYIDFTDIDLVTTGNDLTNLKLFFGDTWYDPASSTGHGFVSRFNGVTGIWEGDLWQEDPDIHNLAIASDYPYPAANSNPFSLAVLYSVTHSGLDSIICRTSSNGGISLDTRKAIAGTSKHFHKVAISYARSPSCSTGRYYTAWEEQESVNSNLGHIFTAHTTTDFNSNFTKPVKLDSIDPTGLNRCRNPKISCQVNNADNDSANLTEVVLFEKYHPSGLDYDVMGYYNLQATATSYFSPLNIAATSNNELQPDICFNPYNSKFMVTYFDSTTKKLPFLTNDINLANPDSWNVVSQGYNDNSNLVAPYPKVRLNFGKQDGMNAWISEGTGGNGIAPFDAPYSTYTGISGNSISTTAKLIGSYPNPCSNSIKIAFELKNSGKVIIDMMSIMGQPLGTVTDQDYSAGKHTVQYNVSGLPDGNYLYTFKSGESGATGKITVIR